MLTQNGRIKFTVKRVVKTIDGKPAEKPNVVSNKNRIQIDEAYKELFASLFKIKDKDVQRRVLQAVNGQNLTCANCANKIQTAAKRCSSTTQTVDQDFEYLNKINSSPNLNATKSSDSSECFMFNKIQLRRARRKFEPYVVKAEPEEKCNILKYKFSSERYKYEPGRISYKLEKPETKTEEQTVHSSPTKTTATQKLVCDHLDLEAMSPNGMYNFPVKETATKFNDMVFLSTMEEEMRTAFVCNEEGLYTIHRATINGDLFKMRRILIIYEFCKRDINIRTVDGKGETPLHFAMSSVGNVRNNDIINLLYDGGADVLAINDEGDSVLHLAAETIHDFTVATKLISRISLDDLSKTNDKGQTILHIAALYMNRTFVKAILNLIDTKLNISSIGKDIEFKEAGEYFKILNSIHLNYVKTFINENFKKPTINAAKSKILNEHDGRTGKTAIFLSLNNNDESVSLMLMAHLADTRIPDFNNTTCSFFCTEVLKNRKLAQAIYNADSMHNAVVVKMLKQPEKVRGVAKRISLDVDDDSDIMAKVTKVFS